MARICLISPGHLSTNPRLVKEADALEEAGHDVWVIAADFIEWARMADLEFADRPWQVAARLPFGPDAPLKARCLQLLRQRTAKVLWRARLRRLVVLRAAWHPLAPDLVREACRVKADLYIAHYPAALPAAALAAMANGARYAYDAEDFHIGDPPEAASFDGVREMIRALESAYLPGCAYVSAASPGIAKAYEQAFGIPRPTVILNVFPLADAPFGPTARGSARPGPSVYWFSQTIGPDRGLECLARAIGLARAKPHMYLQGTVYSNFSEKLVAIATEAGGEGRVHFLAPERPSLLPRRAATFDVGYVGETGMTPNHRVALANKIFTYWLAGIPCVASATSAHQTLADEAGAAMSRFPINDPIALAGELDSLLGAVGERLRIAREQAHELGRKRFNWDVEKHVLTRCVAGALQ